MESQHPSGSTSHKKNNDGTEIFHPLLALPSLATRRRGARKRSGHLWEFVREEVVEVYLIPKHIPGAPLQKLVGFQRIHLRKLESKQVAFTLDSHQLSIVSPDGKRMVAAGDYEISVGGGQPSPANRTLTKDFRIVGGSLK